MEVVNLVVQMDIIVILIRFVLLVIQLVLNVVMEVQITVHNVNQIFYYK